MTSQVPVVLFAFNRPEHLEEVLSGLKEGGVKKLYIFVDGARGEKDSKGIAAVKRIIKNIDWAETAVFCAKKNKGLNSSIVGGLTSLFSRHDKLIIIEDDIKVAPDFYPYMCEALEFYQDDPRVAGVTGLRYPFDLKALDHYPADVFFEQRFCSWGWGTWARAWKEINFDIKPLALQLDKKRPNIEGIAGFDMQDMARKTISGDLGGSWDVIYGINMILSSKYFVWPKYNMVKNLGIGTGTHLSESPPWSLAFEPAPRTKWKFSTIVEKDDKIHKAFVGFFDFSKPSLKHALRNKLGQQKRRIRG